MTSSSEESEPEKKKVKSQLRRTSQQVYLAAYQQFVAWKSQNSKDHITEQVLLEYFQEQSETKSPSTLYSIYSMIRSIVLEQHGIDMKQCAQLQNFLKQRIVGYIPKESKQLTAENVETFLNEAPDDVYLTHKVALLLGLYGACRGTELCYLGVKDIHKSDQCLIVDLKDKTGTDRSFAVRREDHVNIIERYRSVRPKDMPSDRFFLKCSKGKCIKQVIGKNRFCEMPSEIAEYLKLPDPKRYRGNCFRISSSLWYSTAKDLMHLNERCTIKPSELKSEKITSEASDEGTLIPAEFLNVEIKVENIDDDENENAKTDTKDRLEDEYFDHKDDDFDHEHNSPLKVTKIKQEDSESVSSEQESSFLDPLNHGSSASFKTADNTKDSINENINSSTTFSVNQDTHKDEFDSSTKTPKATVTSKISINQDIHETTITLPNKTVKLIFKNCKNVSNIRINL